MRLLLGIDGGGTKTDAVLCSENGKVLGRLVGPASSPTSNSAETVQKRLKDILEVLLQPYKGLAAPVDSVYAGISGAGLPVYKEELRTLFHNLLPNAAKIEGGSDSNNAINSVLTHHEDGVVAIAGTGSCAFARLDGVMHQVGGWGYLLGDEGSGYELGRMALTAALRDRDGRGQETVLTELCEAKLGNSIQTSINELYQGGRNMIASFAPCLLQAAEQGDALAIQLREQAARGLLETILSAGRLVDRPVVSVVMAGSIWQPEGYFEKQISSWLGSGYKMLRAQLPPVFGAVVEAAHLVNINNDITFYRNFKESII